MSQKTLDLFLDPHKRFYTLFLCVSLSILAVMLYSTIKGSKIASYYIPLVEAVAKIKQETTAAHLWAEEIISGDVNEQPALVWKHLDNAEWYIGAILTGGERSKRVYSPLTHKELRSEIQSVQGDLKDFKKITQNRFSKPQEHRIGSALDQSYDQIFKDLINATDKVETDLQSIITSELNYFHTLQSILIMACFILFAASGFSLYLHERRQLRSLREISLMNRKIKESGNYIAVEKERLSVTLRSIGDGVITSDTAGNVVLINKVAEELTGWRQEEAFGRPVSDVFNIINERTGVACENPVEKVLELGKIIGLANHTALITKNGKQRSIADSGAPIRDKDSKIIGVVLVFRDITDQLKTEEELLKIKKLESIGVLAGGIAHDFNNILSAILGNINLASQLISPNHQASPLLLAAEKATIRAEKLTKQLLTFAKGGDPVKETANISQIIKDSANFVLHGSNVSCVYSISNDLWMVDIDPGQIGQVIQNLIINASHAMPDGGNIDVCCANISDITSETLLSFHRGDYVKIAIQDHGIGIPEHIIDRIFDPFFTTKQKGSGLGLATCQSIINKHDGHITVDSKIGEGTQFTIYLPASSREPEATETKQASDLKTGSGKIMVMDDEEMVRDMAKQMLVYLGYEVELVKDGKEALKRYRELQEAGAAVNLTIMDLTIPGGMGGKEAVQEILAIDPMAKVIVASGYSTDPILANYSEYGCQGSVAKPFDLTELSKTINSALA